MIKHLQIVTLFALFITSFLQAQTFTNLHSGFPSLSGASTAWADYDGDGDLDVVIVGFSGVVAEVGSIYRNDGDGLFTLVKSLEFPVSNGAVNWGDYDHDGDPDLLVNGQGGLGSPAAVATLYNNNGNDEFVPVSSGLPGVIGIARWMDYDGDGWLDVIMGGIGNSFLEDSIRLFHNDTTGMFSEILVDLPGYYPSDISVVDFDVDGDMDFFFTGGTLSVSTFPITLLFSNEGNAQFTQVAFPFINLSTGTSAWADYDHDGDPDLLYDGLDSLIGLGVTLLYRNDSSELFTRMDTNLPGSGEPGSVDWADVDGDGDLDILLGGPTTLLRNDGNNFYTDITPSDFQEGVPGTFADFDQDGDQDVLIISFSGGLTASTIHRNELINDQQFLVPGRQWIYAHNVYDALPDPLVDQSIETITIGNDTLINGLSYSMLTATLADPCGIFSTTEFLREEGEKIYRLSEDHSQEFLMIDFDETVGYTMLYDNFGGIDTGHVFIDSFGIELAFDGTPVDVQYMRIHNNQSFDDDTEYKVYRNVGFVQYGLLFPNVGTGLCDVMEGIELRCYVDGLDTIHFTEFGCYEITLMNETQEPSILSIQLSPNPASNEIYLPEGYKLKEVCIIQGQPIAVHQIGDTIYTDSWPAGVYVLWLTSNDKKNVRVGRIVKQ